MSSYFELTIYECIHIYRTSHIVSWRFTILLFCEIGRQLVKAPLAAAISPYLTSPTHPTHRFSWTRFATLLVSIVSIAGHRSELI